MAKTLSCAIWYIVRHADEMASENLHPEDLQTRYLCARIKLQGEHLSRNAHYLLARDPAFSRRGPRPAIGLPAVHQTSLTSAVLVERVAPKMPSLAAE
jgi:hypothetical protein